MKAKFNFRQYVWIFIIGCYTGYAVETLWCLIKNGYIESRRSLVLGHLSVAYGMGAVLLTLILVRFQGAAWWKIFLISFFSGTVTEYICSLGQEICFGSVAWDYSHLPLNINGRAVKPLYDGRVLIRDANDNRYEIPDYRKLDKKSKAMLMPKL